MHKSRLTAIFVIGLFLGIFILGNFATGQTATKVQQWEYMLLKHSPHLTETGTDFKEIQALGKEGWQLTSSYTLRGEVVVSIFKRPR